MLFLKNNIKTLSRARCNSFTRTAALLTSPVKRSFTSSMINKKDYSGNNQDRTATCQKKEVIDDDTQDPFVAKAPPPSNSGLSLSFMPVVIIPQTEFAHSTFFSQHRPLLGLANDKETSFFANQSSDVNVDEQIANYMANLQPFEVPAPPGATQQDEDYTMRNDNSNHDPVEMEENYYLEQLPMYYMPESDELVEYLSDLQERLLRQSAFDHITSPDTLGRIRRRQVTASSTQQQEFGSPSFSSSIPSRYQKRHRQGLYRHRWNK
ncbi:hypothetical protein BCR42DRAFT_457207 [Absidia repens]|uniref:Mitochondrial mRNA-processing protein COX24 C-terminal domain-containing protein n=1 Tax=Absidia repens TaxID=90262 RepID=A0A1X2HX97_9FUNG|nr:hypothetical protein BCR42DRAFT_457207 [Absidia repens]